MAEKVSIYKHSLNNVAKNKKAEMALLLASPLNPNPKKDIEKALNDYVASDDYCDFVEEWLDNPWLRLVIKGIENLSYSFNKRTNIASWMNEWRTESGLIRMGIFYANPSVSNPQILLDNRIIDFVGGNAYNAFVASGENNPWVKIALVGINNAFSSSF